MGDARRRAIEIADLKSRTVETVPEPYVSTGFTVEEVFSTDQIIKVANMRGASNWVTLKERANRFGDRKHNAGHGDEQRDAVIDNQRFDVSAAVTKRLAEKAKAKAEAEGGNDVARIATGLSDAKQEVVQEQASEGPSDILRKAAQLGIDLSSEANLPAQLDNDQSA